MKIVVALNSTRTVVKAERLLKERNVSCRVIPLPRELSSECGMAIEIEPESKQKVIEILNNAHLEATFADLG